MLALSTSARPVETGVVQPLLSAAPVAGDAHCGCGEGKMARVAAATRAFAASVDVLDQDASHLTAADGVFETRLAAAELACRQRQPVATAPMSGEMRQWSDTCAQVAAIAVRYRAAAGKLP